MHHRMSFSVPNFPPDHPHGGLDVKSRFGQVPPKLWTDPVIETGFTPVSASALHQLPHHEALCNTHSASTRVPLTMSGFLRSSRCPTMLRIPKCIKYIILALPWNVLHITSASGGICVSFTQVSRQCSAWNCFCALFQKISHLPCFLDNKITCFAVFT